MHNSRECSPVGRDFLPACRFGEIALNTQIDQKLAVGKKHAQLPQKAIRSEKAEIFSMQEDPVMYIIYLVVGD